MTLLTELARSGKLVAPIVPPSLAGRLDQNRLTGLQLAALDINLRRLAVAGGPIPSPLSAHEEDVLLAGATYDCAPLDHILTAGRMAETFTFAGDLVKAPSELYSSPEPLAMLREHANWFAGELGLVFRTRAEDYAPLQATLWAAQAVRLSGPELVHASSDEEAAHTIIDAFFGRGSATTQLGTLT